MERSSHPHVDVLVFGQGPVIAFERGRGQQTTDTSLPKGALNQWGREIVAAGADLFHRGTTDRFLLMGGQTGPAGTDSEARLLKSGLVGRGVPETAIVLEESSTNTLENLVNICNDYLDQPIHGQVRQQDLSGATFHLARMKLLANLFAIKYDRVIGADEVTRFAAREAGDTGRLAELEKRSDGLRGSRGEGDSKTLAQKQADEDVWTRALLTIPEYSMKYFGRIKDDSRLRKILHTFDALFPDSCEELGALARYGITSQDLRARNLNRVRQKLLTISRIMPNDHLPERLRIAAAEGIPAHEVDVMASWRQEHAQKGWPKKVEKKFQQLLYASA